MSSFERKLIHVKSIYRIFFSSIVALRNVKFFFCFFAQERLNRKILSDEKKNATWRTRKRRRLRIATYTTFFDVDTDLQVYKCPCRSCENLHRFLRVLSLFFFFSAKRTALPWLHLHITELLYIREKKKESLKHFLRERARIQIVRGSFFP